MASIKTFSSRFSHITVSHLATGLLAGFLAGAAAGFASRGAMRLIALALGMRAEFSLEGTLALVFMGSFFGAGIGFFYAILEGFAPLPPAIKGLAVGVIVLGTNLIPIVFGEPVGELALLPPLYFVAAFLPVYLIYGLLLAYLKLWLDGWHSASSPKRIR